MTNPSLAFPLLALALAACEPVAAVPPLPDPGGDACGASGYRAWIGQDASVVEGAGLAGPVRVYHQGDALTMDFSPTRLNVELDADGRIIRIHCG